MSYKIPRIHPSNYFYIFSSKMAIWAENKILKFLGILPNFRDDSLVRYRFNEGGTDFVLSLRRPTILERITWSSYGRV